MYIGGSRRNDLFVQRRWEFGKNPGWGLLVLIILLYAFVHVRHIHALELVVQVGHAGVQRSQGYRPRAVDMQTVVYNIVKHIHKYKKNLIWFLLA